MNETEIQRAYYERTASSYNDLHVHQGDMHWRAMAFMRASIDCHRFASVLDVGAGTGRVLHYLHRTEPSVRTVGVEPVEALRDIGHAQGLSPSSLIAGDGLSLPFPDGSFDLVCAFGVLHHVKYPDRMIAEMLRVANRGVFISDANNFGQGSLAVRFVKQAINAAGLWPLANFVKTKGKGYSISEGDGLAYSYSVFSNYDQIKAQCPEIYVVNTERAGANLYRTASHVALLALK